MAQPPAGNTTVAYVDVSGVPVQVATATPLPVTATITVASEVTAATSTVASVNSSGTNVTVLAASAARLGAFFFNDSTAVLYLKLGATATTSSYTVQIPAGGFYELPSTPIYTGIIDGIWASANGAVRVTSLAA